MTNRIYEELIMHKAHAAGADPAMIDLIISDVVANSKLTDEGAVFVDKQGIPRFDQDLKPVSIDTYIGEMKGRIPQLFRVEPKAEPTPAPSSQAFPFDDRNLTKAERYAKDLEALRAARSITSTSQQDVVNPFHPKTANLTQQMILIRRDPALADRLKREAGK